MPIPFRPKNAQPMCLEEEMIHRQLVEKVFAVLVANGLTEEQFESLLGEQMSVFVNSVMIDIVEKFRIVRNGAAMMERAAAAGVPTIVEKPKKTFTQKNDRKAIVRRGLRGL